jgi:hypothetical protein
VVAELMDLQVQVPLLHLQVNQEDQVVVEELDLLVLIKLLEVQVILLLYHLLKAIMVELVLLSEYLHPIIRQVVVGVELELWVLQLLVVQEVMEEMVLQVQSTLLLLLEQVEVVEAHD